MYTLNNFVYGHKMATDEKLNNELHDWDFEFREKVDGKKFTLNFPYHGGQCAGSVYSCILGCEITDDDQNPHYIDEVRSAKEEDYSDGYKKFIGIIISGMEEDLNSEWVGDDKENYVNFVNKFKEFIKNNEPCFYSVESSS